uniref:Uncharacterized protein n=1 Tax=Arundo donax TaxID=35708 RepID=A0A0A9D0T7_ARUDO
MSPWSCSSVRHYLLIVLNCISLHGLFWNYAITFSLQNSDIFWNSSYRIELELEKKL